jgi:hypothetical protein
VLNCEVVGVGCGGMCFEISEGAFFVVYFLACVVFLGRCLSMDNEVLDEKFWGRVEWVIDHLEFCI